MTQTKQTKQVKPKQAKLPRAIAKAVKEGARETQALLTMPIIAAEPWESAKVKLQRKVADSVVAAEPIPDGVQTGKLLLTLQDGTQAIWKPASGEGGHTRKD